jgi:DNA-binding transcriptional ArsR family regulator
MRNRSVTYSPEATFHALADPTRRAVLDLLRSGASRPGRSPQLFPDFPARHFQTPAPIAESQAGGGIAQWTASHLSTQLRAAQSGGCMARSIPPFWQMSLGNLKSFVEQEYARESGELAAKGSKKAKVNPGGTHEAKQSCTRAHHPPSLSSVLTASMALADSDARKSFDLLKQMEGNWAGQEPEGRAHSSQLPHDRRGLRADERDPRPRAGKHDQHVPHGW